MFSELKVIRFIKNRWYQNNRNFIAERPVHRPGRRRRRRDLVRRGADTDAERGADRAADDVRP